MRALPLLTCFSLMSVLSACGTQGDLYDSKGNRVDNPNNPYPYNNSDYPNSRNSYYDRDYDNRASSQNRRVSTTTTTTTYKYDRPGYYNYDGSYIGTEIDFIVPEDMFPPRGKCRIWYSDRDPSDQPRVQSCKGIKSRVPDGAYVIYGG